MDVLSFDNVQAPAAPKRHMNLIEILLQCVKHSAAFYWKAPKYNFQLTIEQNVESLRDTSTTLSWTNTEAIQLTVQTSTWALIFALLILSGSIIGGIVVFALLKRRRRRRSGPPPRFASVHHKGRVRYRHDESESAASNATESQAASMRDASMSRGPSSIWGRGSVSFTNVDDPQPTKQRQYPQRPKKREKSPKIKNDDRRSSTSLKAKIPNKNENVPKSTSVQVSLREHQRPSDKRSKSSKVTNGQRKNKIG
uniref:Uncharacterized protein n=1 Tax=Romanomermis culicivorax TaxID=13658 RepID=A0A915LBD6_ROMCU